MENSVALHIASEDSLSLNSHKSSASKNSHNPIVNGNKVAVEPVSAASTHSVHEIFEESTKNEKITELSPDGRYAKLNVVLGKGACKVVWKALDLEDGVEVAWNCVKTTKTEFSELLDEIKILKRVCHPNIISLHDFWYTNNEFVFITELMTSGTLREYIKKLQKPSLKVIKRWSRQVLRGLAYLHSRQPTIIHRDIKCDNIFINGSHGEIKIGDMGTAKMKSGKKYTLVGTPEFMAPEMYEERGYSEKVDMYAFGMCLLEMVTGDYPYSECKNAAQIYKKVSQGIKPECLQKIHDKPTLDFINLCLAPEASRITSKQGLVHPFLADEPEVILVSTDDCARKLTLQLVIKNGSPPIKFDFWPDKDTAHVVVSEMINEKYLAEEFKSCVIYEINRIIREATKNSFQSTCLEWQYAPAERRSSVDNNNNIHQLPAELSKMSLRTRSSSSSTTFDSLKKSSTAIASPATLVNLENSNESLSNGDFISFDSPPSPFANNVAIDKFVVEAALSSRRSEAKAKEWIKVLKNQDIFNVGDLRQLHEEDWATLDLTVFAQRALKNYLNNVSSTEFST